MSRPCVRGSAGTAPLADASRQTLHRERPPGRRRPPTSGLPPGARASPAAIRRPPTAPGDRARATDPLGVLAGVARTRGAPRLRGWRMRWRAGAGARAARVRVRSVADAFPRHEATREAVTSAVYGGRPDRSRDRRASGDGGAADADRRRADPGPPLRRGAPADMLRRPRHRVGAPSLLGGPLARRNLIASESRRRWMGARTGAAYRPSFATASPLALADACLRWSRRIRAATSFGWAPGATSVRRFSAQQLSPCSEQIGSSFP